MPVKKIGFILSVVTCFLGLQASFAQETQIKFAEPDSAAVYVKTVILVDDQNSVVFNTGTSETNIRTGSAEYSYSVYDTGNYPPPIKPLVLKNDEIECDCSIYPYKPKECTKICGAARCSSLTKGNLLLRLTHMLENDTITVSVARNLSEYSNSTQSALNLLSVIDRGTGDRVTSVCANPLFWRPIRNETLYYTAVSSRE